jgi:hypothetical protein
MLRVQFCFSHEDQALQISDILIGAIAYRLNRHYDRPDANEDKKRLCDFIFQKTGFDKRIFPDSFRLTHRRHPPVGVSSFQDRLMPCGAGHAVVLASAVLRPESLSGRFDAV